MGIALFLAVAGLLWYQVVSSTDVARVGQEEQSEIKIEPPEIPPFSLPGLPNIEEKKRTQSTLPPEQRKGLRETDYSILRNTPCVCGCKRTLAECRCSVALEEIRKMGIILEEEIAP